MWVISGSIKIKESCNLRNSVTRGDGHSEFSMIQNENIKRNIMVDNVFLFNESNEIKFKLQLFYKENDCRRAVQFDAAIRMNDGELIMLIEYGNSKYTEDQTILLLSEYKKDDYRIIDSTINEKDVSLKLYSSIQFTRFYLEKGKKYCSMSINHIHYEYIGNSVPTCYRLTPIASQSLIPYLTGLAVQESIVVGIRPTDYYGKCLGNKFYMYRDEHRVYVQTEENMSDIMSVLSFFFCNPIEYDMVSSYEHGNRKIDFTVPEYKIMGSKRNEMLGYLFYKNYCMGHLYDFLKMTNNSRFLILKINMVKTYIDNMVRAEYLDSISKLLLYHSIIEKIAEVGNTTDTYNLIHKFFRKEHLNIEKLNDGIESKGIQNENKENISNFVQLRNFFVHHLGSKKAQDFLRDSDMLFYLKMAITILLLKRIGIEDVKFDKQFHGISIFDDSIDECDTFTALFEA